MSLCQAYSLSVLGTQCVCVRYTVSLCQVYSLSVLGTQCVCVMCIVCVLSHTWYDRVHFLHYTPLLIKLSHDWTPLHIFSLISSISQSNENKTSFCVYQQLEPSSLKLVKLPPPPLSSSIMYHLPFSTLRVFIFYVLQKIPKLSLFCSSTIFNY